MLYFLRHDMVSWVIAVVAISLLALFMFIPNRVYLSLLASAFLSIGLMACVAARGMGAEKVIGLGFILVLPIAVGFFTALRWQLAQRQQYALLMQVISSNRDLQDEIKRREALEAELAKLSKRQLRQRAGRACVPGYQPGRGHRQQLFRLQQQMPRAGPGAGAVADRGVEGLGARILNDPRSHQSA